MHEKKDSLPRRIQEAIDKGATTVEEIHTAIADLPLKMLEDADVLKGPAKEIRRVQDQTIGAIYGLVREINERVGTLATELLEKRRRATRAGAHAK